MKTKTTILILLIGVFIGHSQGFVNLDFEQSIVTNTFYQNGSYYGSAIVPGWEQNLISFNGTALDAPDVTLVGTNVFVPLQGNYSIYLQGGSSAVFPNTNGASIGQTGTIPDTAQSIIYWGNALQVTFNGQPLLFNDVGAGSNYTIWEADISAYAGQTGLLLFTVPWENNAYLDNIQFSSTPVPEPSVLALVALGAALLGFRYWRKSSA